MPQGQEVGWFHSGVPGALLQEVAAGNELWPQGHNHYLDILHMELLPTSGGLRREGELKYSSRLIDSSG